MKTLLTIILTLSVVFGIKAYAGNAGGMKYVDILEMNSLSEVYKIFDENTGAVCYVYDSYRYGGISCLK
jgi:hypothetical protein